MRLRISILPDRIAVCRLDPGAEVPSWVRGAFTSVTRTPDELSILCDDAAVPEDVRAERGWRALKVEGPIPFELTGVAAALVAPLAEARISVFLLATFDTDYLLLKEEVFGRGVEILRAAGHDIA
ncbi:MAG TPA: ACT domain-containing protein [Thermoanaerobaculia bacterium]|nr:ACT domain-containing protein [Thermoanaerobaculia bacterium]